ncbi:MAG: LamG domain-containing protein [Nitrososphaerales archaeon]
MGLKNLIWVGLCLAIIIACAILFNPREGGGSVADDLLNNIWGEIIDDGTIAINDSDGKIIPPIVTAIDDSNILETKETDEELSFTNKDNEINLSLKIMIFGEEYKHNGEKRDQLSPAVPPVVNPTAEQVGYCPTVDEGPLILEPELLEFENIKIEFGDKTRFDWQFRLLDKDNIYSDLFINKKNLQFNFLVNTQEEGIIEKDKIISGNQILDFTDMQNEYAQLDDNLTDFIIKPQAYDIEISPASKDDKNNFIINATLKDGYVLTFGDIIYIDPTILINVNSTSNLNNVTIEPYPYSHLTMNETILYYNPFDVNATLNTNITYDYSQFNRDILVTNGSWNSGVGMYGGSYFFNGNTNGTIIAGTANAHVLSNLTDATISAWVKLNASLTGGTVQIFGESSNTMNLFWGSTEDFRLIVFNESTASATATTGSALTNTNVWYHLVGTYNGSRAILYLNVNKNATSGIAPGRLLTTAGSALRIGSTGAGSGIFNGSIDEVMAWNRTLTDAEIMDLYKNQSVKFYPRGEQIFNNINVSSLGTENFLNLSITQLLNLTSNFTVQVGSANSSDLYIYGQEAQINTLTGNVSGLNFTTPNNISIKLIFNPANLSTSFYTPVVLGNLTIESYTITASTCPDGSITTNGSTHCANNFSNNNSVGGAIAWSDVDNARVQDGSYATTTLLITQTSTFLKASNFTWGIPANATINGVKVEVIRKASVLSAINDNSVRLVLPNGTTGTDRSNISTWETTDGLAVYGNATDLWGLPLTFALMNDTNFGFLFSVVGAGAGTASVDSINMTVFYTEVAANSCSYSSGTWNVLCSDYCNITSNTNLAGNNILLSGLGKFNILANLSNVGTFTKLVGNESCLVSKSNGATIT